MTAYELAGRLGEGARLVRGAGEEIERLLADDRRDLIRQIANRIYQREHLFVIGRGPSYPLALEAALKVKEVSYVHAEGFAGGEVVIGGRSCSSLGRRAARSSEWAVAVTGAPRSFPGRLLP